MDQNFPVENSSGAHRRPEVNVNVPERLFSVLTGSLLVFNAIRKGRFNLPSLAAAGYLIYRGSTGHDPIYSALGKERLPDPLKNINIRTTVTVNRPRMDVYTFWRNLENLPLFMRHLEKVTVLDSKLSHWIAAVPGGFGTISWDAEIVEEREGSFLGWHSLADASIENAGKVEFRQISESWTELDVTISYRAPLGAAGHGLSRLLNPVFEKMIQSDIMSFKRYIEKGPPNEESIIIVENVVIQDRDL